MRFSFPLAVACAALLSLSACGGGGGDGGTPAVAVSSPAALKTIDNTVGTGTAASAGARVQVTYTGWLYSAAAADFKGTKFDATQAGQLFTFVVGAVGTSESAIAGFSQGVQGMKVGGKRTILIPSGLAYGTQGVTGRIPPNSGVVFDVELVKVCGTSAC
jgi:FKBP-type peptidyl-prolyl cis-trans isomerase FkpA